MISRRAVGRWLLSSTGSWAHDGHRSPYSSAAAPPTRVTLHNAAGTIRLADSISPSDLVISRWEPTRTPVTLKLYRGFHGPLRRFTRLETGEYLFDPSQNQQGVLWFTHKLIYRHSKDYIAYARQHGTHLITYPLECWRHEQIEHLADGTTRSVVPDEIEALGDTPEGAEGSRFWRGYEVPAGWFFSYKIERFICCDRELAVSPRMIRRLGRRHLE